MAEAIKEAKLKRRTAKAALTRIGKALNQKIDGSRPAEEIAESLENLRQVFDGLVLKHEDYAGRIEDEETFTTEEAWMDDCQEEYLRLEGAAKDYLNAEQETKKNKGVPREAQTPPQTGKGGGVANGTGGAVSDQMEQHDEELQIASTSETIPNNANGTSSEVNSSATPSQEQINTENSACGFKMEKPKMPTFSGDVRDYVIFRADFKHVVDQRFSKRDAITLLRTSLVGMNHWS